MKQTKESHSSSLTQLVVVYLHAAVGERTEDGDDGDLANGHLTHMLKVLVPLLHVHAVRLRGGGDHLGQVRQGHEGHLKDHLQMRAQTLASMVWIVILHPALSSPLTLCQFVVVVFAANAPCHYQLFKREETSDANSLIAISFLHYTLNATIK